MKLYRMYFSPTGGTKKAAKIIGGAWDNESAGQGGCERTEIDLSDAEEDYSQYHFSKEDVCIVAVPSFGGRVPGVVLERLNQMEGGGAKAVLIAAYGNRAFEDTLLELEDTLVSTGFTCVAGVAMIAEHSIMRQFGQGRPDEEDRKELCGFAARIKEVMAQQGENGAARISNLPGNRPYREYNGVPFRPEGNKSCTKCGLCAKKCPVGAIPAGDPSLTDKGACISCMRCVVVCPQHARDLNKVMLFAASQKMKKVCSGRKNNELFI